MAIFNLETRAPYWKNVQFVWFIDAGNVFRRVADIRLDELRRIERRRLPVSLANRSAARRLGLEAQHAAAAERRARTLERAAYFPGAGILMRIAADRAHDDGAARADRAHARAGRRTADHVERRAGGDRVRTGRAAERPSDDLRAITGLLVDRELILREVQRYAPPAPTDAAVDARLDEIRTRFRGAAGFTRAAGPPRLHRSAAARVAPRRPADGRLPRAAIRVGQHADRCGDRQRLRAVARRVRPAGTTFEQAAPLIRERLITARRAELIDDWLSDLRRRTDVVILNQ